MAQESTGLLEATSHEKRCVGLREGGAGPTMIVMTGIHGNEPAGQRAAERVLARIDRAGIEIKGRFVALAGNLKALAEKTRFIDRDLNREWTPEKVARLETTEPTHSEASEQRELLTLIRELTQHCSGPVFFLDLHTTSAAGPPFITVGDTLRNRRFARSFPMPLLLGLEDQVDGALLEYLNNFGLITLGAEAGQHDCDRSADRLEALLWLALGRAGMVAPAEIDSATHTATLRDATRKVPKIIEVRYRHPITPDDQFKMLPGFDNFVPIAKGQVVAHDRHGEVRAPEAGLMLLPLYQGKGNDGFFVARPVRVFWLRLSAALRRRRLGRFLHWLPGVTRGEDRRELIVDTRIARWYPLELFHLFGFRKRRREGALLRVSRRAYDFEGPTSYRL